MSESLLRACVQVSTFLGGGLLTRASGFLFARDGRTWLATSAHVVHDEAAGHLPDRVGVALHVDDVDLTRTVQVAVPLYANGVARSFFPASWRDSHPDELAAFVATLKTPNKQGMAIAGRSVLLDRASVLPLLPQIKAPTVVVAGELDALYPAPTLKAAADRIPGARFVEIPGGGHISAMNQPDRVTALLERELMQWSQAAP